MLNYDNIEQIVETKSEENIDNRINVEKNYDCWSDVNNKKHNNDSNSNLSNSMSNYSKNVISISSINEFNNSTDIESVTDSYDADTIDEYILKNVENKEITNLDKIEQAIKKNSLPNPAEELISNINVNNLTLNQSAGVTIGNTNNIKYIVNQYYSKNDGNDNQGFENDENDLNKNVKTSELILKNKYISALHSRLTIWILIIIGLVLIIGIAILMNVDFTKDKNNIIEDERDEPGGKFFTRSEWGALPAKQEVGNTNLPLTMVVICHTGDVNEKTEENCKQLIRSTQIYHLESQNPVFADIGYSFLICGDGNVYEGRGWRKQNGIVDNKKREETLAIGITGNYDLFVPTKVIINATKEFLRYAVENKKLVPRYKLYAHNTFNTILKSPGHYLKEEIKKWRYFTNE